MESIALKIVRTSEINVSLIVFMMLILFCSSLSVVSADFKIENRVIHSVANQEFVWEFSCGNGDCLVGQFLGGNYWIAPKSERESVDVTSVSTGRHEYGLMMDPGHNDKQGFLSCQEKTYDKSLNLMFELPIKVEKPSSLIKASKSEKQCGTKSITGCCVGAYSVLTVLSEPPGINDEHIFRPSFAEGPKRIYRLSDFDFDKLPSSPLLRFVSGRSNFGDIHDRWHAVYVDHYMGSFGDLGRAYAPNDILPDYGAAQAALYLGDLLSVMDSAELTLKLPALTGLIQRGIDLYGSWEKGIEWPSGAGQQMGRKPPMSFFASLVKDNSIKSNVMAMSVDNGNSTQEDGQIRIIKKNEWGGAVPIWGDRCEEKRYWANLFNSHYYTGSPHDSNPEGDNVRTCGDPYGWIDGPAGKPGGHYMSCCSTGGFIAFSIAQNLMPELCRVSNNHALNSYVKRVLSEGIHTQPDPCAPPDTRESKLCQPWRDGKDCLYYMKTWGPDPSKPGSCIINGTSGTTQSGRFPHLHGLKLDFIGHEPLVSRKLRQRYGSKILGNCSLDR